MSSESVRVSQRHDATGQDSRRGLVEKKLIDNACMLFAQKGFGGTTLTDIAESMGLTRAAIYYYFKNKEAVLEAVMHEVTGAPIREIQEWRKTAPDDSCERLRSFVVMRIHGILSRQIPMRMIEVTEAALPPDLKQRHLEAKRRVLDEYRIILRAGMECGDFRMQDERTAALGIIGIVNWTANWYAPDKGMSLDAIAAQLAEMAVMSVAQPEERAGAFRDARGAIQTLRDDIDQLARLIGQS